jgi:hypothetical protein
MQEWLRRETLPLGGKIDYHIRHRYTHHYTKQDRITCPFLHQIKVTV